MAKHKFTNRRTNWIAASIIGAVFVLLIPTETFAPDFPKLEVPDFKKFFRRPNDVLVEVGRASCGPGGMCVLPGGDYIISCHQFFDPQFRAMRMKRDGSWEPFPNIEMNVPGSGAVPDLELDSVVGLACDPKGIVWMLDNGRRTEKQPKLIAWDTRKNGLHALIRLGGVTRTSFLKNIVLDPNHPFIYISDPANGDDAAIIVVDLTTQLCRRVLEGHFSVRPDPSVQLHLDGKPVEVKRADGEKVKFLEGVSPVAVDRKGTWLYFGARNGKTLFKIRTDLLRDPNMGQSLRSQVRGVSDKPVCDSIALDSKNNIYFTNIATGAIDFVTPDDDYLKIKLLVQDPRIIWPGGISYADDRLHFFSSQLHRTKIFTGEKNAFVPPFHIFKVKPHQNRFRFGG